MVQPKLDGLSAEQPKVMKVNQNSAGLCSRFPDAVHHRNNLILAVLACTNEPVFGAAARAESMRALSRGR